MKKILFALALSAFVTYIAWPYYSVFVIDDALGNNDLDTLSRHVDLDTIRGNYEQRLGKDLEGLTGDTSADSPLAWLQDNLRKLGKGAVEQVVDLPWVADSLKQAARKHFTETGRTPYFIGAVDYAFFESPTRFLVRLGDIGENPAYVRLSLEDWTWRITDIID